MCRTLDNQGDGFRPLHRMVALNYGSGIVPERLKIELSDRNVERESGVQCPGDSISLNLPLPLPLEGTRPPQFMLSPRKLACWVIGGVFCLNNSTVTKAVNSGHLQKKSPSAISLGNRGFVGSHR